MRALGYPRVISIQNFRTPNFELVADCLFWLVQRYDPGTDIVDDIATEQERVAFLQSIAQIMLTKSRLKLNIKRLYAADGHAVKELLKIADLLHKATIKATEAEDTSPQADFLASFKTMSSRAIRQLTSEITQCGAALHDILGKEPDLREGRMRAANAHMETNYVERTIQEATCEVDENIKSHMNLLGDLNKTTKGLEAKIDKRKSELERSEKRLSTLQGVRPAYMDEYEKLQVELQTLYSQYLERCRNLQFLESELEQYHFAEQEKMDASSRKMKKMQNRLREEELRILRGEQEVDENNLGSSGGTSEEGDSDSFDDQGVTIESMKMGDAPEAKIVDGRQVVGDITGGADEISDFDDDASIEEDTATDSSEISVMNDNDGAFTMEEGDFEELSDLDDDGLDMSDDNF
ncbi:hypothetical protein BSKO_00122 [Bryopsis sp. KO-2023]|nr:hypothetical protein BSKO_00122 [Bryopsis sp. KO-2023]